MAEIFAKQAGKWIKKVLDAIPDDSFVRASDVKNTIDPENVEQDGVASVFNVMTMQKHIEAVVSPQGELTFRLTPSGVALRETFNLGGK